MSAKAPVIAFVSPKGGAGKTTATLTLASELIYQTNSNITLIDADPNYPFKRWVQLGRKHDLLDVVFDESEETIVDNIEAAKANSSAVLVDLEGTKNMRVSYAVSQADLVIIPVQGSILDANEAAEAIKLIKRTEKAFKRSIEFGLLFTRMPAAIISRNFSDIARQFTDNKIPVFESQLTEREAFKTMFSTGLTLHELAANQVGGLEKAKEESYKLALGVTSRINAGRKKMQQAA